MSDLKEHGILFSAPMVLALHAGTKTQTRRIVKDQSAVPGGTRFEIGRGGAATSWVANDAAVHEGWLSMLMAPHGPVGRRLWVRETVGTLPEYPEALTLPEYEGGHDPHRLLYRADEPRKLIGHYGIDWTKRRWRPAIHMPRWASRITLEVTRVRLERVQSITEDDARAEGVSDGPEPALINGARGTIHTFGPDAHRKMYALLWDTINGAGSWASNPWTWAYDFKRIA